MMRIDQSKPVPNSLALPLSDEEMKDPAKKIDGRKNRARQTTHERRKAVTRSGVYVNDKNHNSRYKQTDTQEALKAIFNRKCAFCQRHIEASEVEHYRPKTRYPWLAYSWDNLLWACGPCNSRKSSKFKTLNPQASYQETYENDIHHLADKLARLEKPALLHPCLDDPQPLFTFEADGNIDSDDERGQYTIETCGLNRQDLKDDRLALIQELRDELEGELIKGNVIDACEGVQHRFIKKAFKKAPHSKSFQGFRQYIAENELANLINQIVGEQA